MNSKQPAASIIALSFFFLTSVAAHAHASLTRASPAAASTMSAAPHEVTLTFTDTLEAVFSKIAVTDTSGIEVSQGKAQVSGNTMSISLKPLKAGVYELAGRVHRHPQN